MNEIKNIIFDLGVVILNLDRQACIDAFSALGVKDVEKMTTVAGHSDIFGKYEKGEVSTSEFFDQIRELSALPLSDEQINLAWLKMIRDFPNNKLDTILKLRESHRVFLLSNTNEIHWNWCKENMFSYKNHTAEDYFEKSWLSNEIHLLKPSREIFEYVLLDGLLNPEETLFVDDAEANCNTARSLGIKTYQPVAEEDWTYLFK